MAYKKKKSICKYCHREIIWRNIGYNSTGYRRIPIDEATGQRHNCKRISKDKVATTQKPESIEDKIAKAPTDAVSSCPDCNGVVPDCTGICMNCGRIITF